MAPSSPPRVLLIQAPFGLVEFPHLGTSLVKASVEQAGFQCDVRYATIEFARRIGFVEYLTIERSSCAMLLPERPFASLISKDIPSIDDFYQDLVDPFGSDLWPKVTHDLPSQVARGTMKSIEAAAAEFTHDFAADPRLRDYPVIAFSSSYGQQAGSLALAQAVKRAHPDAIICFGGANVEGHMGLQLPRSFPFVDYAFSGDGDLVFPRFLEKLRDGEPVDLPGVFDRDSPDAAVERAPLTRQQLDELPYPDYSDYFDEIRRTPEGSNFSQGLPIEGSRGCWWGEKHHCTFCGLNGVTMGFRSKSPDRFIAELAHLVDTYREPRVMASDNIMDRSWLSGVLPRLAEERRHQVLFYEIKANLRKDEVRALADAGVTHLQPGIESLSTHVLKLMDKGTTSLQNLQLLKWAEEFGINVTWNVLSGFPGEKPEDYDQMAELMRKIPHFQPPTAFARISVDRFSPFQKWPEKYGIEIHPSIAYRYIFDLPDADIENLAYWFYYTCENGSSRKSLAVPLYARNTLRVRAIWERIHSKVHCRYHLLPDGSVRVEDGRPQAREPEVVLTGTSARIFQQTDKAVSRAHLLRELRAADEAEAVDAALEDLESRQLLHREGDAYLALPITADARPRGLSLGDRCVFPI